MKAKLMFMVQEAGKNFGTIAQFNSNGFIFVAELKNCGIEDFIEDKEYDVDVKFYGQHIYNVYENEEEYYASENHMSSEAIIPAGAFNPNPEDKRWKPAPFNYINSKVVNIEDSSRIKLPGKLYLIQGQVLGHEIDQSLYWENKNEAKDVKIGNIVLGLYWAELKLERSVEC